MRQMPTKPFTSDATDDLELACAIERDAALLGSDVTLERYLPAITQPAATPMAMDAAVEVALRAACSRDGVSVLEAARSLTLAHPIHGDAILAVAFAFGLEEDGSGGEQLAVGNTIFGRWRVLELLGEGATAQVVRARDELLSRPNTPVEVVIKRFDDEIGGDARLHALREMRALLAVPAGIAPRPIALHAPPGEAAHLIVQFEASRPPNSIDDFVSALEALRLLHKSGFAHGDLKRDHIRIRGDRTAFFIDFGCATPSDPLAKAEDRQRISMIARTAIGGLPRVVPVGFMLSLRSSRPIRGVLRHRASALTTALLGAGLGVLSVMLTDQSTPLGPQLSESGRMIDALRLTGRFLGAELDANGRIDSLLLQLPELDELGLGQSAAAESIVFDANGAVLFLNAKSLDSPSQ